MRTIKFRGKDIETGEWIYGHFFQRLGHYPAIVEPRPRDGKVMYYEIAVEDTTVGQFTGLLDKNGKEIYEGDIVTFDNHLQGISQIVYDYAGFDADSKNYRTALRPMLNNHMRVVGNIHDNPELLKAETL